MIVWALFDSGNGCYTQLANEFEEIELYAIGIDRENKHDHFINLNLADYSRLFGSKDFFNTLDQLPKPDLIIASPPCESWSVASAMDRGNACWKKEEGDSLFSPQVELSPFTVRDYKDYEPFQFKPEKSIMTRINGELCIFNTIEIIKRYKPKFYIIENPAHGRIWKYIDRILGFKIPYDNLTYYNNYGFPISKPTKFKSNLDLELKNERIPNEIEFRKVGGYNTRSNIPLPLVKEIFEKVLSYQIN
ncbi:hypothetical protein IGK74_002366 [Enterococcus sp. AZ150]|uniref:DNA methyltransferase n=1 Tax=Enterococcus sp. AZ150 TaxID=2774866 RepID=UPI003F2180DC